MEVTITQEQGSVPVTVVHVDGKTDSASSDQLEKKIMEVIESGARYLILDLGKVPYMSSAGLRVLQQAYDKLRSLSSDESNKEVYRQINEGTYKSPNLKLINPTKDVMEVLKISGFDMLISVEKDLKTAVASF